jgi:hypothetical protein
MMATRFMRDGPCKSIREITLDDLKDRVTLGSDSYKEAKAEVERQLPVMKESSQAPYQ